MIRLLIAEDSPTVQRVLVNLLKDESEIDIVGIANNGTEAVNMCQRLSPDLVTMDIFMPELDGLEATRKIMTTCPTRIVIVSSMVKNGDTYFDFEAMRAGAIQVIEKPTGILTGKYQQIKDSLLKLIATSIEARPSAQMSWLPSRPPSDFPPSDPPPLTEAGISISDKDIPLTTLTPHIVCIGGSTGAPTVIVEVLKRLPEYYPIPLVIAQHITRGFAAKMTMWLDSCSSLNVRLAKQGDIPIPGTALVCPDDQLLSFSPQRTIHLSDADNYTGHIPSIDRLFSSAAQRYKEHAIGIILSGMGRDGADGLLKMKRHNAYTIAQTEDTSVVYGMNKVATELGATDIHLSPMDIAEFLREMSPPLPG